MFGAGSKRTPIQMVPHATCPRTQHGVGCVRCCVQDLARRIGYAFDPDGGSIGSLTPTIRTARNMHGADINWCWAGRCWVATDGKFRAWTLAARMMRGSNGRGSRAGRMINITPPAPVGWVLGYSNCRLRSRLSRFGVNDLSLLPANEKKEERSGGLKSVASSSFPTGKTTNEALDGRRCSFLDT